MEAALPVRYIIAAAGAAVLFAFIFGYHQGAEKIKRDMAIQAAAQAEDARKTEKALQEKLNSITENYLHEIDEYKKTISAYADNDISLNRLSGAHDCPAAVPGKAGDKPGFACYSAADIQRKVSASLAIAAECDEIAIRYKALAESCK